MKLLKISYRDLYSGWSVESCSLFPDLNLLVGISGAGKTTILEAIGNLKKIANGESFNGVKWDVEFVINKNHYRWKGEFETKKDTILTDVEILQINKFRMVNEYLYKNDIEILKMEGEGTFFCKKEIPQVSSFFSFVELLNSEKEARIVKEEFNKIDTSFNEYTDRSPFLLFKPDRKNFTRFALENLREDDYDLRIKLLLLCKNKPEFFLGLKQSFTSLFPQVEDLEVEIIPDPEDRFSPLVGQVIQIKIREKDSDRWILQKNIASGMLKSFIFLSLIELAPDGSVILMDEFDRSLGMNCLEILTEILSDSYKERDLQFIVTSHHPYVIDRFGPDRWKIVTRKNGVITARNAEDYPISKTRQKAGIDLMKILEKFPGGIDRASEEGGRSIG